MQYNLNLAEKLNTQELLELANSCHSYIKAILENNLLYKKFNREELISLLSLPSCDLSCIKFFLSSDLFDLFNEESMPPIYQLLIQKEDKYTPYTGSAFLQALRDKNFKLAENLIKICLKEYLERGSSLPRENPLQYLKKMIKINEKNPSQAHQYKCLLKELEQKIQTKPTSQLSNSTTTTTSNSSEDTRNMKFL